MIKKQKNCTKNEQQIRLKRVKRATVEPGSDPTSQTGADPGVRHQPQLIITPVRSSPQRSPVVVAPAAWLALSPTSPVAVPSLKIVNVGCLADWCHVGVSAWHGAKENKTALTGVAGKISFLLKWNAAFNVELLSPGAQRGALAAAE